MIMLKYFHIIRS